MDSKSKLEELVGDKYANITTYALAIFLGVIALVIFEYGLDRIYDSSAWVRYRIQRSKREPFVEGWWVDVGLDYSGGIPEILNCSFIAIIWYVDELKIEGRTWEKGAAVYHHWDSIYALMKHSALHFGYKYTTFRPDSRPHGDETGYFQFELDGKNFNGRYDGGRFTSVGQLQLSNRKLFGSHYKLPDWNERERVAKEYMAHYANMHGYDPYTLRFRLANSIKIRQHDAFIRFVKQSNNKATELDLLDTTLRSVSWPSKLEEVLDIGPGDGTLSVATLRSKALDLSQSAYTAVDPNGLLLEELSERLRINCGRVENDKTTLVRADINGFASKQGGAFDLLLGFHCLYYVNKLEETLTFLFEKILKMEGYAFFMHTDILSGRAHLLRMLAQYFNPNLRPDVVSQINRVARTCGMQNVVSHEQEIKLEFPVLDHHGWERVAANTSGTEVAKAIELITFMVDRAPDNFPNQATWRLCVDRVRSHLRSNNNQIIFPLVSQVFKKV